MNSICLRHFSSRDVGSVCVSPAAFGCGLFLAASILDHSCAPNAVAILRGRDVAIVALEDVAAFEDVRISYTDCLEIGAARRRHLASVWFFACHCDLCSGRDPREATRRAMACPDCEGCREMDKLKPLNETCQSCGRGQISDEELGDYQSLLDKVKRFKERTLTDSGKLKIAHTINM